jgi:hypothetical protein
MYTETLLLTNIVPLQIVVLFEMLPDSLGTRLARADQ